MGVRFMTHRSKEKWNACAVYNLKTHSWSKPKLIVRDVDFKDLVGTFLKGYLYWIDSLKIVALNVDKMVSSCIHQSDSAIDKESYLGTCRGCLWMITNTVVNTLNFDVWVMNEQGVDKAWSKACSLAIGLEPRYCLDVSRIIEITEEGRIIIYVSIDGYHGQLIIYDTSKHSYKYKLPKRLLDEAASEESRYFQRGVKYKESLISPVDICRVRYLF